MKTQPGRRGRLLGGLDASLRVGFGPRPRRQTGNVLRFEIGQSLENVQQIFGGVDPMTAAAAQYGVNHGAACARLRVADEEKILLPDCRGANRVLAQVMPPPDLCRVVNLEASIPDVPEPNTRHNHRLSRKARSLSFGR